MAQTLLVQADKDKDQTLKRNMGYRMEHQASYWMPTTVEEHLQTTLAVETQGNRVDQKNYQELLRRKISRLLNQQDDLAEEGQDNETKEVLQMSLEYLPEIYTIAEYSPRHDWADQIAQSDTIGTLTRQINWSQEITEIQESQQEEIKEVMAEESLMSFLEHL